MEPSGWKGVAVGLCCGVGISYAIAVVGTKLWAPKNAAVAAAAAPRTSYTRADQLTSTRVMGRTAEREEREAQITFLGTGSSTGTCESANVRKQCAHSVVVRTSGSEATR